MPTNPHFVCKYFASPGYTIHFPERATDHYLLEGYRKVKSDKEANILFRSAMKKLLRDAARRNKPVPAWKVAEFLEIRPGCIYKYVKKQVGLRKPVNLQREVEERLKRDPDCLPLYKAKRDEWQYATTLVIGVPY